MLAGARAEVDQVVGGADRLFVVLDDDDAVALVAQPAERGQQAPVVALVQADRRLVEHVEDAGQVGADLRRQADALPFPAGQRRGAAAERQVADADVVEEAQAIADLAQQPAGDEVLALGELEALEGAQGVRDGQRDVLGDGLALDADGAALGTQAVALAVGARAAGRAAAPAPPDPSTSRRRSGGAGSGAGPRSPRRRDRSCAWPPRPSSVGPGAAPLRFGPVQEQVALLLRQLAERDGQVDAVDLAEPIERAGDERLVARRPGRDGALGERLRVVRHDARRVEVPGRAEALAGRRRRPAAS